MGAAKLHEWVASPAVVTCVALGPRTRCSRTPSIDIQPAFVVTSPRFFLLALSDTHAMWALKQADATGNFLPLLATRGLVGRRALVRAADDFVGIATEHERAQPGYVEGK